MHPDRSQRFLWVATAVLLLAAIFRLAALRDVPPGLSQDEVLDAGMPAFILAGNHAVFFREGYGHEPLYHYWGIPFYLMLGENYLQSRLASVSLGMLLVALIAVVGYQELALATRLAAGNTKHYFLFFFAAAVIYLVITLVSNVLFGGLETYFRRGQPKAA